MKRHVMVWLGIVSCFSSPVRAHTLAEELVLVDTDTGLDDLRAIALLQQLPGIEVTGIITCDGSNAADTGAVLVRAWLRRLGWAGIEVWAGSRSAHPPPPWRPLGSALLASLSEDDKKPGPQVDWRRKVTERLRAAPARVTVLALGPLTNVAELLRSDPGLKKRLARIVWYGSPASGPESFNRDFDPEAAGFLLSSGVPLVPVASGASRDSEPVFSQALLDELTRNAGQKGEALRWLFSTAEVRARLDQGHFRVFDEAAALFLVRPEAFTQADGRWTADPAWLLDALVEFFRGPAGTPPARDNESFDRFPRRPEEFRADLAAHAGEIIARHGPDEFRACVLVSELHQHLGIYSLVGVKMGLWARELLGEPDHPLQVVSFAGSRPPLSCLNDGLQVGAGATLGLGMIRVVEGAKPRAAATFSAGKKSVTLVVKPAVVRRIAEEIAALKEKHGALDAGYYRELRALAIRLWLELDRATAFDTEPAERR